MRMSKSILTVLLLLILAIPAKVMAEEVVPTETTETTETESAETAPAESKSATGSVSASKGLITTDDFEIRVECGLNGSYKYGASIPVTVYITSKNEDFEGIARMVVPGDWEAGTNPTAYEKDIMLPEGEQKVVTMSVYNNSGASNLYFQLENSKGKKLINQRIVMTSHSGESALVGVLSDDYTALNYLDKLEYSPQGYYSVLQVVELDDEVLPDQASGLEALSYLVINSYETSKLGTDQIAAIRNWVEQGGVLVLGTGADYQQTLSGIPEELAQVTVSGMAEGTLCAADDSKKKNKVDFDGNAGILKLSMEDSEGVEGILTQKNLVWKRGYGKGCVAVTAFNLGLEPVNSWADKQAMAMLLFENITDDFAYQRMKQLNYGSNEDYWSVESGLLGLRKDRKVNGILVFIILMVFVVLMPVAYLILKKMDKRGLLWVLIPAGSALFTAIILIATGNVRIRYPVETSITTLQQEEGKDETIQSVNMSLLVPSAKRVDVKLADTLSNLRLTDVPAYYDFANSTRVDLDYKEVIRENAEGYTIGIENHETFATNYLTLESSNKELLSNGITADLVRSVSGISGKVTNNTGYDMKGVLVFSDFGYVSVGEMKDGETKEIKESENIFNNADMSMQGSDVFFSIAIPGIEMYSKEYQQIMGVYGTVFNSKISSQMQNDKNQSVYVMGYLGEWKADYITDENIEENNAAVYVYRGSADFKDYEGAEMVSLQDCATLVKDWDPYDGSLYSTEVEEVFVLENDISSVYALVRCDDSVETYRNFSNTRIYAWNIETEQYEELFTDENIEKFEDGCPYLDDMGQIKMKFTCKDAYNDYVPTLTLIGGGN